MKHRFDRGMTALKANDRAYVTEIDKNAAPLAQEVLRLEIVMGLDSPAELAKERLQLQVDVLQSSLKSGAKGSSAEVIPTALADLCSIPVLVAPHMMSRMTQLIVHCKTHFS